MAFILPSITDMVPVTFAAKKHPQTIMLPPPNFTVGTVFFGLKASLFFFVHDFSNHLTTKF